MGWGKRFKDKEREMRMQEIAFRAVVTVRVAKVQAALQGEMQTKLQTIECSGLGRTEGEAVENALADGVEQFVEGLSRVVGPVLVQGPSSGQ